LNPTTIRSFDAETETETLPIAGVNTDITIIAAITNEIAFLLFISSFLPPKFFSPSLPSPFSCFPLYPFSLVKVSWIG
jgi:hypothetical protein